MINRNGDSLSVSGNMTIENINSLFKEGLQPRQGGSLTVDFAQVDKMDSSAVSLMLVWVREAARKQCELRFVNVPQNLLSLAKMYGVADMLNIDMAA